VAPPGSKLAPISAAIAVLSLLWLGLGLLCVSLLLPEPQPSMLFVPSSKGLTRILVELVGLGLGSLGLLFAAAAWLRGARGRRLLLAALVSVTISLISAALLI